MKKFLTALILIITVNCFAQQVVINSECVHLNELLGDEYPMIDVQCGFTPGTTKTISSAFVTTILKRSAMSVPRMPEKFSVYRSGEQVNLIQLHKEITELYEEAYKGQVIKVSNVRFGRTLFMAPDENYELKIDTFRLGNASGLIIVDGKNNSFMYEVSLYDYAYITNSKVNSGGAFIGSTDYKLTDITKLKGVLVKDISSAIAAKSLSKGRILTTDLVKQKPERIKGDSIELLYVDGDIKLKITGVAEEDAVVGKTIRVKNPTSGIVVKAVYQGNGKAIVK